MLGGHRHRAVAAGAAVARARLPEASAAVALVAALTLYLVLRDGLWLHRAAEVVPLPWATWHQRTSWVPGFVRYSLPDALWQYALAVLVWRDWWTRPKTPLAVAFLASPVALGLGVELGQGAGVVQGVFDPVDLAASIAALAVAVVVVGSVGPRPSARRRPQAAAR